MTTLTRSRTRNPLTLGCTLSMAAALLVSAGCGKRPAAPPAGSATPAGIAVSVKPALRTSIDRTVEVTGSLVALGDVTVGARIGGKIVAVNVHEGDAVVANQVVAIQETTDLLSQLQSAQAGLQAALTREQQARVLTGQAQKQLEQAQTNLDITDQSTRTGLEVAKTSVLQAQERLKSIRSGARPQERRQVDEQVRAAKANLDRTQADLRRMRELAKDQAVSQSQVDSAQAAYDSASASYNGALEAQSLVKEGARQEDVRQAELAVQQAQEGLAKAESDRALVKVRQNDVTNARANVRSMNEGVSASIAGVRQATAALRMAQNAQGNAYIRTPISGYVASRLAEPGQQVGSGAPVVRIVAPNSVYLQATLAESQYSEVTTGMAAAVTVDAVPGREFAGTVARILPVASAAARSFTVRIDFRGDSILRPQMFARGRIRIGTHDGATVVDKDAVLFDPSGGKPTVFVAEAGKASARLVTIGYTTPDRVEIIAGVRPGDKVIVMGQSALQSGDKITVQ